MSDYTLNFKEVTTLKDAMKMRTIRNDCRLFMTHDRKPISIAQQEAWFFTSYKVLQKQGLIKAFLAVYNEKPAGYGLIRYESVPILSGGLKKQYRGRGLGEPLFRFLLEQVKKEHPHLDVLEKNHGAIYIYTKLGFKETHRDKGIIYMNYK